MKIKNRNVMNDYNIRLDIIEGESQYNGGYVRRNYIECSIERKNVEIIKKIKRW